MKYVLTPKRCVTE